jgi:ketosteroid isomerase-like protein
MSPAEGSSVPESVLAAMRQTNELFNSEVVVNQNFDALDHVYTAEARILPPGAPMIAGREQIKGFWKQAIAALGVSSATLTTVAAETAGDGVVEIGSAELSLANGQKVPVKYVVHWKPEDGAWKWNIDIWNTNA